LGAPKMRRLVGLHLSAPSSVATTLLASREETARVALSHIFRLVCLAHSAL
jgi:hypothetical protein